VGDVPRKRHTVHRDASGARLNEELMGVEGFSNSSSLLYHRHSPSAVLDIEAVEEARPALTANHPVAPLHLRTTDVTFGPDRDVVTGRQLLLGNDDVVLAVAEASRTSPLYRNAVGDELVFVARGSAVVESVFGRLAVTSGDYVVIPTGTTHRWVIDGPQSPEPTRVLLLEARGHIRPPRRYLSPEGQFLEHAPFCERDVRGPEGPLVVDDAEVDVIVRTRAGLARHRCAHHPFDVVGWDGCLYPWALSIHDFEPIVGSLHQPPPVHQTFEGPNFVVCSFVPRPYDFHADAVKVPYHHANVDSDEVLFYVDGDFMSRAGSGIGPGSLTVHPAGFVHGPQPGSWERSVDASRTDELAVMLDTFRPLLVSTIARSVAAPGYQRSWSG
jgi:homogentisate 1,2-dioxygenase